jgi:hypothetical protein
MTMHGQYDYSLLWLAKRVVVIPEAVVAQPCLWYLLCSNGYQIQLQTSLADHMRQMSRQAILRS